MRSGSLPMPPPSYLFPPRKSAILAPLPKAAAPLNRNSPIAGARMARPPVLAECGTTSLRVRLVPPACNSLLEHGRENQRRVSSRIECSAPEKSAFSRHVRERDLHYCLRERSVAWPTSHSTKQSNGDVYGAVHLPGGVIQGRNAEGVCTLADECYIVRRTLNTRNQVSSCRRGVVRYLTLISLAVFFASGLVLLVDARAESVVAASAFRGPDQILGAPRYSQTTVESYARSIDCSRYIMKAIPIYYRLAPRRNIAPDVLVAQA